MKRKSGILLHITSLSSPYGIGDFGPAAYKFADFLSETKQRLWQVLPLNPTNQACANSPYSSTSSFAGNTNFISPELLVESGLLAKKDIMPSPSFPQGRCDYSGAISFKQRLFGKVYKNFTKNNAIRAEYERFSSKNAQWLDDFAVFEVIRGRAKGRMWQRWDKNLRDRRPGAINAFKKDAREDIERAKVLQYIFFKQWFALKSYCNKKNIELIGDIPIYVSYDSADVWSHRGIFKLDKEGNLIYVSGVPPDYFSKTGQLWGNPVYRWSALLKSKFKWWLERLEFNLTSFDMVRIDHFRGLVAYWEVPADEKTAVNGRWVKAPAKELIETLKERFPRLPVIAEDLGYITPDVREVLRHFRLPGMKVLLFAFGANEPMHPYLPHTYDKNWVVYTGTHDNNTSRGWFENEAKPDEKARLLRYLGRDVSKEEISWEIIRLAMMSVANIAIFPMQDILGLGEEARMNVPSTIEENWQWRLLPEDLMKEPVRQRLLTMAQTYGRAG